MQLVMDTGHRLVSALAGYRIQGSIEGDVKRGPKLDTISVKVAAGTRLNRVRLLSEDLARAVRAKSVRVTQAAEDGMLLFEIARTEPDTVTLQGVLGSVDFLDPTFNLPIGLGVNTVGNPVVVDLAKAPHMLIAGTTGSGKSMLVNSIIMSVLANRKPTDVKLILCDPKMLEFSRYDGVAHLQVPVLTDPEHIVDGLELAVGEMTRRHRIMHAVGARDLDEYNAHHFSGHALPRIVIVIDELADLMAVADAQVENAIRRLSGTARAAGIHLIVATQRPSVDVVTGVIKANLPTRVCLRVASKTDSRVVLDQVGGEGLLGHGDMLFLSSGSSEPMRVHGPLVTGAQIDVVASHWRVKV